MVGGTCCSISLATRRQREIAEIRRGCVHATR